MFVSRVNAIRASRKVDINVLVPIKRCIDYAVKVRVSPDGKGEIVAISAISDYS